MIKQASVVWGFTSCAPLLLLLTLTSIGAPAMAEIPLCGVPPVVHFNAKSFSYPTRSSNKWFPLVPGTRLILEGQAIQEGTALAHRVVSTVTDLTKVINGVRTIVFLEDDISEDQLVERELAFFAEDNAGSVWSLGEYPEEFEEGKFVGARDTWIAGLAGAAAGIHMLAKPRLGTPRYLQGWAPDIDFLDCAKVIAKGLEICVPFSCYKDVLVTDEVSPLDPDGGHQRKFHAPGVGIVQVGTEQDPQAETLALVNIMQLSTEVLAKVRETACALDQRAYRVSEVYRDTPPAKYHGHPCR